MVKTAKGWAPDRRDVIWIDCNRHAFEPRVLSCLETAWTDAKVSIWLDRKQFEQALAALLEDGPGFDAGLDSQLRRSARVLESQYPTDLLNHYLRKRGPIEAGSRRRYTEQAHYVADIKRVMLDHLVDEPAWVSFSTRLKTESKRLTAFQDELKKVLPDAIAGIRK